MADDDELLPLDATTEGEDAWTDDDDPDETTTSSKQAKGDKRKKVWTERSQPTAHGDAEVKVLERLDRRKRRRARKVEEMQDDSAETSREIGDEEHVYHS